MKKFFVLLLLQLCIFPFSRGDDSTGSPKDLDEKEAAEFKKKKYRDELEEKNEQETSKQTLAKLDKLGNFKSSVQSLFENIPAHYTNTSSDEKLAVAGSNLLRPQSNKITNLSLNQNHGSVDTAVRNATALVKQAVKPSTHLSEKDKEFVNAVRHEVNIKDVKGKPNIMPAHHRTIKVAKILDTKPVVKSVAGLEDEYVKPPELHAEFMNKTKEVSGDTNHHTAVKYIKNLTNSVLKPGDIEHTSHEASGKNPIRLKYQHPEHLKMYFEKKNKEKEDKERAEMKAKVTVFGADDIDLSTSLPNIRHDDVADKQEGTPTANGDDKKDFDRLKLMKDYLKHTRKALNFRSKIPVYPKASKKYKVPISKKTFSNTNKFSESASGDSTESPAIVGNDEEGISESHDTNI